MKDKYRVTLQIILVIALIVGALVFKVIPEYKESQGSSDAYIKIDEYKDMVELKINNHTNFALITTDKIITNILFFDSTSLVLYNQDIENTSFENGIKKIISILIENNYLKTNDFITLTAYHNKTDQIVKDEIIKYLNSLNAQANIIEEKNTIEEKAKSLRIEEADEKQQLKAIEYASKDIVRKYKNNLNSQTITQKENITEENIRDYTDNVYKKLEQYVRQNEIINQDITSPSIEITKIPANQAGNLFPDNSSWYYVQDKQVYAYISITIDDVNYSYCYQASIDIYKKGQC